MDTVFVLGRGTKEPLDVQLPRKTHYEYDTRDKLQLRWQVSHQEEVEMHIRDRSANGDEHVSQRGKGHITVDSVASVNPHILMDFNDVDSVGARLSDGVRIAADANPGTDVNNMKVHAVFDWSTTRYIEDLGRVTKEFLKWTDSIEFECDPASTVSNKVLDSDMPRVGEVVGMKNFIQDVPVFVKADKVQKSGLGLLASSTLKKHNIISAVRHNSKPDWGVDILLESISRGKALLGEALPNIVKESNSETMYKAILNVDFSFLENFKLLKDEYDEPVLARIVKMWLNVHLRDMEKVSWLVRVYIGENFENFDSADHSAVDSAVEEMKSKDGDISKFTWELVEGKDMYFDDIQTSMYYIERRPSISGALSTWISIVKTK